MSPSSPRRPSLPQSASRLNQRPSRAAAPQHARDFGRTERDAVQRQFRPRSVAERRLSEVTQVAREYATDRDSSAQLSRDELEAKLQRGKHVLVDVRPTLEYESGHLQGAISIPIEQLAKRLGTLPRDRRIVVYCRGTYCQFADRAVSILRRKGFDAIRLEGGWPEWRSEGRPTTRAPQPG